jgi:N6-L-threonylcarbamoyladenine synthase
MDTSFGGLQTNVRRKINETDLAHEDIAYSVQETVFAMLVETAERAMAHTGTEALVLGGGVACNQRLQEMCRTMCDDRGASYHCPANEYLTDNAAMIAWTGILMYRAGETVEPEDAAIKPKLRTDQVDVTWR